MIRTSCAWSRNTATPWCGGVFTRTTRNTAITVRLSTNVSPSPSKVTLRRWNTSPSSSTSPRPVAQSASHSSPQSKSSSRAASSSSTTSTAKTIPGPTWLWLEPIYEPFRAYGRVQQRRPYMTQFISALVIYFVGDIVAQSIGGAGNVAEKRIEVDAVKEDEGEDIERGWLQAWAEDRDWHRTMRSLFIGGAAAVPGYRWFLWLGNSFNYSSKVLSLTTKVVVNQLVFTPIFNSYFFGTHSLLSGASVPETITRIQNTVPTSWINSCKLWPAVTAFMFVYVPIQYRSIFGGVIAIGWQTYLSLLNQRAAKVEEEEEAAKCMVVRQEAEGSRERGMGREVADGEKCVA